MWGLGYSPYVSGFAMIGFTGMQSNGVVTTSANHNSVWADRRWISSVSGPILISGQFGCPGDPGTNDDGVVGEILIDGNEVWSQSSFHQAPTAYSVTGTVQVGSTVDLVLNPNTNDYTDWTEWNATVTSVPEPSTLTLLAAGSAGLVAYGLRRRSVAKKAAKSTNLNRLQVDTRPILSFPSHLSDRGNAARRAA